MALDNATQTKEKTNVSVKQKTQTENTKSTSEGFINVRGGVIASVDTLKTEVKSWRVLQEKADTQLYKILEGCLHIKYMCEKEDLKVALLSLLEKNDIKGMKNKSISLCITKLVFGVEDKKCYTYSKVLENAAKLYLQTSAKTQTLSQYLTQNGGIDKLIRKEAVALAKGYKDETWGTEEHFGETICDDFLLGSGHFLPKKELERAMVKNVVIEDTEFVSMFLDKDRWEQFVKMRYNVDTKTFTIVPFSISKQEPQYKSINALFNKWLGKVFRYNSSTQTDSSLWEKYINLCDKRAERINNELEEKEAKLAEKLGKLPLCKMEAA
jgi:hypothetical protein